MLTSSSSTLLHARIVSLATTSPKADAASSRLVQETNTPERASFASRITALPTLKAHPPKATP
jgi:hypothetical protein